MSPDGLPIRELLQDPIDRDASDRLWTGIRARRARAARRARVAQVTAGLALAAAMALWARGRGGDHGGSGVSSRGAGDLRLEDGSALGALASAARPRTVVLSDRSRIELSAGASVDPEANTGAAFVARLRGAATFEVTPGGARRWSIECGHVTIDVIGTRFQVVDDGRSHVRVSVEHGIVVVRGEAVPDHLRRLVDGQSLDVDESSDGAAARAARVPAAPAGPAPEDPPAGSGDPRPPAPRTAANPGPGHATEWRALARDGSYDAAYQSLGADGLVHESAHASVDELLALADVARLSGHPRDCVLPLTRVLDEHGTDPRASLAAFTLGRVQLETLARPDLATTAFSHAITLGLPQGLIEDAYLRLVESQSRSGDGAGARATAAEYARKYPHGTRTPTMARWIGGD